MSLAGFSSHDASFGYWNSPPIEAVAVFFMMLAGVSVALYFVAWRQRSLRPLWRNVEARAFVGVMAGAVVLISLYLWRRRHLSQLPRGAAPHRVPRGLGRHDHRLRDAGLCAVAAVRAAADAAAGLLRHLRRLHRRAASR